MEDCYNEHCDGEPLVILYTGGGYQITVGGLEKMYFASGDPTENIKTRREAFDICRKNGFRCIEGN